MTAAKKKIVKYRLTVAVYLSEDAAREETLYIVGNLPALGAWNAGKAVRLRRMKNGSYKFMRSYPAGEYAAFKILCRPDFGGVEKGIYGEEIHDHAVTLDANKFVPVVITKFRAEETAEAVAAYDKD
jgi:hypothetical protein